MTASACGSAARAALARLLLRACSTTWWPVSTSSFAAISPSPVAEPETNTRAMVAIHLRLNKFLGTLHEGISATEHKLKQFMHRKPWVDEIRSIHPITEGDFKCVNWSLQQLSLWPP
jgi:hypothetical protein